MFILITAEKIAEIKKKTKNGCPVGELKNELINEGYTKEDIAKYFEVHKADMRSWYLFFGSVFFIIGIWVIMKYNNVLLLIAGVILLLLYFKEVKE
jgi:hypothetical protein